MLRKNKKITWFMLMMVLVGGLFLTGCLEPPENSLQDDPGMMDEGGMNQPPASNF